MTRILVIDDHGSTADGVANALRERSHQVDVVASPVEAEMPGLVYDLALVDMLFPDPTKSGLDVLETLSQAHPGTKLVIFTAGDGERRLHLAQAFKQFEIKGALPKSMRLEDLVLRIEEILAGNRYFDPELEAYRPRYWDDPCVALMTTPSHEAIWIALAEGRRRVKDIESATRYKNQTIRLCIGEMADKLVRTGLAEECEHSIAALAAFATAHEEFFLNWKWRTANRKRFRSLKRLPRRKTD